MYNFIYDLSFWIALGLTGLLLMAAGWLCYRSYQPRYMRTFPLYCLVNCLSELMVFEFPKQMSMIYNLFGYFELVYFAYFLTGIIGTVRAKRLVWLFVGGNTVLLLWFFAEKGGHRLHLAAFVLDSIILSIPCFTYFREIFLSKRVMNLLQEPSFWMVTGILFYMLLRIPAMLFADYFILHDSPMIGLEVYAVNNFVLCITYILFMKAMTCKTKAYW